MLTALLPCLLCVLPLPVGPASAAPPAVDSASSAARVEVAAATRIRKLHLVRPDLIPYPLAYSVYC